MKKDVLDKPKRVKLVFEEGNTFLPSTGEKIIVEATVERQKKIDSVEEAVNEKSLYFYVDKEEQSVNIFVEIREEHRQELIEYLEGRLETIAASLHEESYGGKYDLDIGHCKACFVLGDSEADMCNFHREQVEVKRLLGYFK